MILDLQRQSGNRAVQRVLSARRPVQRKAAGPQGGPLEAGLQATIEQTRGGGQSLDRQAAVSFGEKLGADFSGVHVHTDSQAQALNDSLNAQAFTIGNDIFFNKGAYNPTASSGQHLLAHELTHVRQQGEAAPTQIQRYGKATKKYTTGGGSARGIFTTQSPEPGLRGEKGSTRYELEYKQSTHAHPKLYFSNDSSLAINRAKKAEAKEFFASDEVFNKARKALEQVGSGIDLIQGGETVSPEADSGEPPAPLRKVTPVPRGQTEPIPDSEVQFAKHICINFAAIVMGNLLKGQTQDRFAAIFGNKAAGEVGTEFQSTGEQSSEVNRLVQVLGKPPKGEDITPEGASTRMQSAKMGNKMSVKATQGYGKSMKTGELDEIAQRLGLNQFANPEIGEGFASFSTRAGKAKKHNWGYHFAGVVARSTDEADWVTLENYNRKNDILPAKRNIYERLWAENKKAIKAKQREVARELKALNESDPHDKGKQRQKPGEASSSEDSKYKNKLENKLINLEHKKKDQPIEAALRELLITLNDNEGVALNGLRNTGRGALKAWFFKMYGSGKGQSFHEQSIQSGNFQQPITLRVRKPGERDEGEALGSGLKSMEEERGEEAPKSDPSEAKPKQDETLLT